MTSKHYDILIIGAGHNGLVAAAYLAKQGRKVLVLERRAIIGGTIVTESFGNNFSVDSVQTQRNARKALQTIRVERCPVPVRMLDEWVSLYGNLIERHQIQGIARFSESSFWVQLTVPGVVVFRAVRNERTIGMLLWYRQGDLAYYHLGAYSPEGYEQKASFALFWEVIEQYRQDGVRWLSLGAGAGVHGAPSDGLTRFKQGWSTGTRTAYFCGRVVEPQKYQELAAAHRISNTSYFPAYRANESA